MRRRRNIYRNGKIHVRKSMCESCPYRHGKDEARKLFPKIQHNIDKQVALPCHNMVDGQDEAVCRGFYEHDRTLPLHLARHMGLVVLS